MNWAALAIFVEFRRIHAGLTVAGAAEAAGVSVGALNRIRSFGRISDQNRDKLLSWIGEELEVFDG